MTSNTPTIHDGETYDRLHFHLTVSTRTGRAGEFTGSASVNFIPYRIDEEGRCVMAPAELAPTIVTSDTYRKMQEDPDFAAAVSAIVGAVQNYIDAKGY